MATIALQDLNPAIGMIPMPRWEDLPRFDLAQAVAGKPYIHVADRNHRGFVSDVTYNKVKLVEDDENPCILVWAGEWLPYESEEEAQQQLRMYVRK